MTFQEKVSAAKRRAEQLQADLEEALGYDADTEVAVGMSPDGPFAILMLTETAAKHVIEIAKAKK